jgi:hypothetical protein
VRRGYALGLPEDAVGLVVFLASDAASSITGQCVGLGGDRLALWSHPDEVVTAYQDGGWSADDIAAAWPSAFAAHEQSYGIVMSETAGTTRHTMALDVQRLVAIDMRTHVHASVDGTWIADDSPEAAAGQAFG